MIDPDEGDRMMTSHVAPKPQHTRTNTIVERKAYDGTFQACVDE